MRAEVQSSSVQCSRSIRRLNGCRSPWAMTRRDDGGGWPESQSAGSPVHQHERAAQPGVGSAGEPDWRGGEALPGDLPLDRGLLGGQCRVGHDPQDQRVRGRCDVGEAHQAHRGPEAAGKGLRQAGQLGAGEAGLGPQQLDQPSGLSIRNYHGIYRNGVSRYCRGMSVSAEEPGWPVEVLAARAGLPVRTIREYQTMRVLEPPVRRGRVAFYGEAHLRRLDLIARLQERGYSLAGIRDLFDAWAAGRDLAGVLAGPDGALAEEAPVALDRDSLLAVVSHLPAARLGELVTLV